MYHSNSHYQNIAPSVPVQPVPLLAFLSRGSHDLTDVFLTDVLIDCLSLD